MPFGLDLKSLLIGLILMPVFRWMMAMMNARSHATA